MIRRPPISTRTEHSFPTRRSSDLFGRRIACRARRQFLDALVDMALPDVEGWQDAHDIVARGHRQQPVIVAQMRDERTAFALEFDAEHQPHAADRSEEHTSDLQSLMRISYAFFRLIKKPDYADSPHCTDWKSNSRRILA